MKQLDSNAFLLVIPIYSIDTAVNGGNRAFQKHFYFTDGTTIRAIRSTFRAKMMEYPRLRHPDRPMRFALVCDREVNSHHGKAWPRALPTNHTVSRPEARRSVRKALEGYLFLLATTYIKRRKRPFWAEFDRGVLRIDLRSGIIHNIPSNGLPSYLRLKHRHNPSPKDNPRSSPHTRRDQEQGGLPHIPSFIKP